MFVKICGVTNEQDALLAVALGADAIGFIFAPSPRQVAHRAVEAITRRLPPEVLTVGVFQNEHPARVIEIVAEAGLKGAQLHGHETPEDLAQVKDQVRFVIKAFPGSSKALDEARRYGADAILLDGPSGGSGQVFDWRLAEGLPRSRRLILSGGLNPDNVADAIGAVHPWGVDVASGVESRPGHKDPAKLRAFMAAVRAAEPKPYRAAQDGPYDWQEES